MPGPRYAISTSSAVVFEVCAICRASAAERWLHPQRRVLPDDRDSALSRAHGAQRLTGDPDRDPFPIMRYGKTAEWPESYHAECGRRPGWRESARATYIGPRSGLDRLKPCENPGVRQVRNVIVLAVGLLTLLTASVIVGAIVCVVAVVGAIVTESRYRRGVPGAETFTGRPPRRPS